MSARPKSVLVALRPAEVETLRAAFDAYAFILELNAPATANEARKARRLIRRLSGEAERAFHVRYERRTP